MPFFNRKKKTLPGPLFFKSNQAAFEVACTLCSPTLQVDEIVPALVQRAELDKEGVPTLALKLASVEGGKEIPFCYATDHVPALQEGDLVAFQVSVVMPGVSAYGTMGVVVAKLKPQMNAQGGWATDP